MAATVNAAFELFRQNLEPRTYYREDASARSDAIVRHLKQKFEVLDAFPTGSIPRYTAVRGLSDLDILVVLHYGKHCEDKTPLQVLQALRNSLATYRPSGIRRAVNRPERMSSRGKRRRGDDARDRLRATPGRSQAPSGSRLT
jgi:hypothetical protein